MSNNNDNQSDFGGREAQTVPGFIAADEQAITTTNHNHTGSRRASVRVSDAKGRESFAATLWNPMKDEDKEAFNRRRLIQLFSGVLIATCGGSAFAFGIFSNKIKEASHFTQAEMTTITTTASVLSSFTFPAGILFDHYGPQYVLMCATVLCCTGFGLLALIFEGRVEATMYSVAAANAITSLGVGFTDGGSLLTNLFNFPINRGEVLIIQKTFFGLGATFLSLIFDGFFGPSDNYLGYAITVTAMMFGAGTFGSIVFRLPPYKRTIHQLNTIKKMDPVRQEMEREYEEKMFEMYHNPRLVDRRRLNAGVTCLLFTLTFFSTFSVIKTYVQIPSNVITGLTIVAVMCMASFAIMIVPIKMPKFFDYEFLPDIHPPETLVDTPEDEKPDENSTAQQRSNEVGAENEESNDSIISSSGNEKSPLINGRIKKVSATHDNEDDEHYGETDGRASAVSGVRASLAGNSAPIAVPQAIAPSVIPSITTPFTTSILRPMLWSLWFMAFCISACSVIISNQPQIMTAANDGVVDKKNNSLAVALMGIGSASGRIIIGFLETFFQRRNALAREEQLVWEAENGPYDPSVPAKPGQPDMRPIYHRLTSSIVCLIPFCPTIIILCIALFQFAPVAIFPVIFVVLTTAYGGWIALLALTVREVFSVDVAKHFNFIFTSGIAAAILLNRLMFGEWFDEQTKLHPAADGVNCVGYICFRNCLWVLFGIISASCFTTTYIVWKWWSVRKTF